MIDRDVLFVCRDCGRASESPQPAPLQECDECGGPLALRYADNVVDTDEKQGKR